MKIQGAILCLLAAGANAFSPKGVVRKSGLIVPQEEGPSTLWAPPNMVAGGAERSYGQEYYEGVYFINSLKI